MSRKFIYLTSQILIQNKRTVCPVRLYARWMNRNPSKVLLPFEPSSQPNIKTEKVIELNPEILKKPKDSNQHSGQNKTLKIRSETSESKPAKTITFTPEKVEAIKSKRNEILKKRSFYLSQKKVFDDSHEIIYEKLKENDSRISSLLVKLKSKKDRVKSGLVLVEGWRLIVDGLSAKSNLKYILFSRTEEINNLRPFLPKTGVVLYKIPYKEIEMWSDVETSPGIFGIFETPQPENIKRFSRPLPLDFVCDNIRVPGNLGAILRVAVGAGCGKMLLTKGCVDLWDPKVVRSAAGAHFRLPIHTSVEWEEMPKLLEENTSVLIADSNAKVSVDDEEVQIEDSGDMSVPVLPYYGVSFSTMQHITLIVGGETEGISKDSYKLAANKNGLRLNIPLQRGIDSLNTGMATAVIAFEIRKQLIEAWTKAKVERQTAHAS